MTRRPSGFTLVEVIACLIILGLISGVAVVSLRGLRERATLEDVIAKLEAWDRHSRDLSLHTGSILTITCDLDRGVLVRASDRDSHDGEARLLLPRRVQISEAWIEGSGMATRGEAAWAYDTSGASPSYALKLTDSATGLRWLVFSGLTGHCSLVDGGQEHVVHGWLDALDSTTTR